MNLNLWVLSKEMETMTSNSQLYRLLRRKLKEQGRWKDKPRGKSIRPRKQKVDNWTLDFLNGKAKTNFSLQLHICPDNKPYLWLPKTSSPKYCPRCGSKREVIITEEHFVTEHDDAVELFRSEFSCPSCQHKWWGLQEAKERRCPKCRKRMRKQNARE